jgi:hypothetical protein
VTCLRRGRILYVVIGAWALFIWGRPRATADLDFFALVKEEGLDCLNALMTRAGMELDQAWRQWNPLLRGSQVRVQYRGAEPPERATCRGGTQAALARRLRSDGGRPLLLQEIQNFLRMRFGVLNRGPMT